MWLVLGAGDQGTDVKQAPERLADLSLPYPPRSGPPPKSGDTTAQKSSGIHPPHPSSAVPTPAWALVTCPQTATTAS